MLHRNRPHIFLLASALLGIVILTPPLAHAAASFTIVNNDGAGEGFNDPTPAAPVGGNSGTTIGQQRLNAFQHAANIWGARLTSSVTIQVRAQFNPLTCNASSGVLGSAGATNFFRDFAGAPVASTWFPVALANALNGGDLDPAGQDINATFNSNLGTTGCLSSSGWYYGLDANPPGNLIDFVTVLTHELGHGLGFLTLVDLATGAKALGFNDAYMRFLERHGASPSAYPSMTNAQRVAASTATGNLHWTGANVRAASGVLSAGKVGDHVRMFAPNPQQSGSSVSHFDTVLTPNQLMEPSYTVPLHAPSLELPLFKDIGWSVSGAPAARNDLLVDFGSAGLFLRLNNTAWKKIHATSPRNIAAGDLDGSQKDEAIASFTGSGLYARFNDSAAWVRLHSAVPQRFVAGDLDGGGKDELIADFGAAGLWARFNNTTWVKLHASTTQGLATGDLDGNGKEELVVDFGAAGLWARFNNATWVRLHSSSPTRLATGDLDGSGKDEVIADFGAAGLWARFNNTTWVKLHSATTQDLATGDLDGNGKDELIVDFGASGLHVRYNNATWVKRHASSPTRLATGDLNGGGKDELIVDFGAAGLWVRSNNTTWVKLHSATTQGVAAGGFD